MSEDLKHTTIVPALADDSRVTRVVPDARRPELVVPAANLEAFYAAMDYGADAIHISVQPLDPNGFSREDLNLAAGHAHNFERKIYVDVPDVVREQDWPDVISALTYCEELAVDAVLISDVGVMRAVREQFPRMKWHAGQRMGLRNAEGVRWAERNGFARVCISPDLSMAEVRELVGVAKVELAWCVGEGGADAAGTVADGNGIRNEVYRTPEPTDGGLLDTADFRQRMKLGVSAFGIHLRSATPVQVAVITDFYRKLIDGNEFNTAEVRKSLSLIGQTEGGVVLGKVTAVKGERAHFKAATEFERHDDIVIDRGDAGPLVKFQTDRINKEGKRVFTVKQGEEVSISAPENLKPGDVLKLISSNAVRRRYPTGVPRKVQQARLPVHLDVALKVNPGGERLSELGMPGLIEITGRVYTIEVQREYPCKLLFADSQPLDEDRLRRFFERLGSTRFELKTFNGLIPAGVFVPAAEVNEARRQFFEELDDAFQSARDEVYDSARQTIVGKPVEPVNTDALPPTRYSAMVDRVAYIEALPLEHLEEVVVDVAADDKSELLDAYEEYESKLRFAVPAGLRAWHIPPLQDKLRALYEKGARCFQVDDFSGFEFVAQAGGLDKRKRVDTAAIMKRSRSLSPRSGVAIYEPRIPAFQRAGVDIATDAGCKALSREAVRSWLDQGVARVTLSPADTRENLARILGEYAGVCSVIVYQHTPTFCADTCVAATVKGNCPGRADCDFDKTELTDQSGKSRTAVDYLCRTRVMNGAVFSWSERLRELEKLGAHRFRLDFINREYQPDEIQRICEQVMNAQSVEATHQGNWSTLPA